MDELINDITRLTDEWYFLISKEHHKDRDCHWYIETKWSYGENQKYYVRHFGYILDDMEIKCETYQEALESLKKLLENAIKYIENEESEW